jgi:hypothetical protein
MSRNAGARRCAEDPREEPFSCRRRWAVTAASRAWGPTPVGTVTGMTPASFPSRPAVVVDRPETGTEMTTRVKGSLREASRRPTAPVTATSTRSLSVTPAECARSRSAPTLQSTTSMRRRGPVGANRLPGGTVLIPRRPSSRAPPVISRRVSGRVASRCQRRVQASWASARRGGAGCGGVGCPDRPGRAKGPDRLGSAMAARTASPPIPSARAWWSTRTRAAVRPSGRTTMRARHSGRSRGNRRRTASIAAA